MRTSRNIFLFTLINLVAGIVFIFELSENVIFGFLSNFYATEFINRWYNLIIPIAQVISAFIIFMMDVYKPDVPHKFRYLISWVAISFTTFVMWVLMFMQYENLTLGKITHWPLTVIILFPIALFMLAQGHALKSKDMNDFSFFGFKGVKGNASGWSKVHKFAGNNSIFVAIVLFALAVISELVWPSNWMYLIAFAVWFVFYYLITTVYALSYRNND
jgi:hypothetical protein